MNENENEVTSHPLQKKTLRILVSKWFNATTLPILALLNTIYLNKTPILNLFLLFDFYFVAFFFEYINFDDGLIFYGSYISKYIFLVTISLKKKVKDEKS